MTRLLIVPRFRWPKALIIASLSLICFSASAFNTTGVESQRILPAYWRAVITWDNGLSVPFNFEIRGTAGGITKAFFLNGSEHFEAGAVHQRGDSVFIDINAFENELAFKLNGNTLTGALRKQDGSGKALPVTATAGQRFRFKEKMNAPAADISGTYDLVLTAANGKKENAVALFTQQGNRLTASILRITGDSRYLEGYVEGHEFFLSSFIGSTAAYYKGSFTDNTAFTGEQVTARGSIALSATQNDNAALPDPYHLTLLKDGYHSLDFSFPDLTGKMVSPKDEKYKGKVLILTISGSWCPNCMDEASFLAPWYIKNKDRGVEIITIHYERKTDSAYVNHAIRRFREKFNITYDEVAGGLADKDAVAQSLPALNTFLSFPTTIFIDKKGKVARIHTGYSGPATGRYYDGFVKEFTATVDKLLSE